MTRTTPFTKEEMKPFYAVADAVSETASRVATWGADVEGYRRRRLRDEPDDTALRDRLYAEIGPIINDLEIAMEAAVLNAHDHPLDPTDPEEREL